MKNKFFTGQICACAQIRRLWQEWRITMKLLSIAIPCYNSAAYMRKCVDSLLPGGEDVEIIIVNDGSKDDTPVIAEEYRELSLIHI